MNNDKEYREHYNALRIFCSKYDPATEETLTDLFSSAEIQKLVRDHIGLNISLDELSSLLIDMKYSYKLDEGNFMWMVKES